jgi:hypothetical protein
MFPQQPTLRRIATNLDQQTHVVGLYDQREAHHRWFWKPFLTPSDSAVYIEACVRLNT